MSIAPRTMLGKAQRPMMNPLEIGKILHEGAGRVPDPIEWVMSDRYLDKKILYPRQGTMLKIIFLRDDMMNDYDLEVIGEWEETFLRTGNEGISPGIMDRIRVNKERGRKWFRETNAAIGRRGGKGHIGGISGSLVTWHYMNVPGGPQAYYGIDPNKRLASIVFAGKKEQAVAYQWSDLTKTITAAPAFQPYISKDQAERLTLFTPADLLKVQQMAMDGVRSEKDIASIEIIPSGNTAMAGRGPAAFSLFFDEFAHIVKVGAGSDAKGIWDSSTPALDQFGVDGFIFSGSSPWQMQGQFYDNCQMAIEMEDGEPVYPEKLLLQLPSWGPYEDWKVAHEIGLAPSKKVYIDVATDSGTKVVERKVKGKTYPVIKFPIQTYDDDMKKLERANPEGFAVERRSRWAAVMDAYLNMVKIEAAFVKGLAMTTGGPLSRLYAAHGDPSKINDNFGFAIGHTEEGDESTGGLPYVVFDVIRSWRTEDFDVDSDGVRQIDYTRVQRDLEGYLRGFKPDVMTFDQFNAIMLIGNLKTYVMEQGFPKTITIYERTATNKSNWEEAETMKAALNMGLIKFPTLDDEGEPGDRDIELLELELKFLIDKGNRVDHPTSGPVQTKDIADSVMAVTHHLIGEQMGAYLEQLGNAGAAFGMRSGSFESSRPVQGVSQSDPIRQLSSLSPSMGRGMGTGGARGMRRR